MREILPPMLFSDGSGSVSSAHPLSIVSLELIVEAVVAQHQDYIRLRRHHAAGRDCGLPSITFTGGGIHQGLVTRVSIEHRPTRRLTHSESKAAFYWAIDSNTGL